MIRLTMAYRCTCEHCKHEWMADSRPARCAKCKRRTWNREGDLEKPVQQLVGEVLEWQQP